MSRMTLRGYPDLLTAAEARKILRVGRSTLYKLIWSGELKAKKIRSSYRIPKAWLMEYIAKHPEGP